METPIAKPSTQNKGKNISKDAKAKDVVPKVVPKNNILNFFKKGNTPIDEPKKIELVTPSSVKDSIEQSVSKKDERFTDDQVAPNVIDLNDEQLERLISNPNIESSPIVSTKLEDTQSPPVVASVVVDLMEDDSLKSPEKSAENISVAVEVTEENTPDMDAPDSSRPARKRKSCNFFDPTPPTRPKKTKAPAMTESTANDIVVEGLEVIATPIVPMEFVPFGKVDALTEIEQELEKEDAVQVEEVIDDEFTEEDAVTNGKKRKSSSKGATKKVSTKKEKEEPPAKVIPTIPPEQQARIDKKMEQINQLINELATYEKYADLNDHALDLLDINQEITNFVTDPQSIPLIKALFEPPVVTPVITTNTSAVVSEAVEAVETPVAADADTPTATPPTETSAPSSVTIVVTPEQQVQTYIRAIIARYVQGKTETLSVLCNKLNTFLLALLPILLALPETSETSLKALLIGQLREYTDEITSVLSDEVKLLAGRESYGHRAKTTMVATSFEDDQLLAAWRWEVHSITTYFTQKVSLQSIREVRALRNRYSRTIKAIVKVVEQLEKIPCCEESKLLLLEEKATKAFGEIAKYQEKRKELEMKKAEEAKAKLQREALKEQKKKEKEEEQEKKKQQLEKEAMEKELAKLQKLSDAEKEKQAKIAAALKTQNKFVSFFNKSTVDADCSTTTSAPVQGTIKTPTSLSKKAISSVATPAPTVDLNALEEKYQKFMCALKGKPLPSMSSSGANAIDMTEETTGSYEARSLQSILQERKKLSVEKLRMKKQKRQESHRRHPRMLKIAVLSTVAPTNPSYFNAFSDENTTGEGGTFTEMTEKLIHHKLRTICFDTDHRPAYVGTFSKSSYLITGRNPFRSDPKIFQYDYDSEMEWEEEEEGEDLEAMNDDEEEEEKEDEEDRDGFFLRDNEYHDGDHEEDQDELLQLYSQSGQAVKNTLSRCREEIVGPYFITNPGESLPTPSVTTAVVSSSSATPSNTPSNNDPRNTINPSILVMTPDTARHHIYSIPDKSLRLLSSKETTRYEESEGLAQYQSMIFAPHLLSLTPILMTAATAEKTTTKNGSKKAQKGEQKDQNGKSEGVAETTTEGGEGTTSNNKLMKGFDETKMKELIECIHGKKDGIDKLIQNFQHPNHLYISKVQIKKRMVEIAEKSKHSDGHGTARWIVKHEFLAKHTPELIAVPVEYTPVKAKRKRITPEGGSSSETKKKVKGTTADETTKEPEEDDEPTRRNPKRAKRSTKKMVDGSEEVDATSEEHGEEEKEQAQPESEEEEEQEVKEEIEMMTVEEKEEKEEEIVIHQEALFSDI